MAKMLASEYCNEVVQDSFRIHGGYGYSKEYEIERLYRDAPLLLIGEGTSEIQRMVIGKKIAEHQAVLFRLAEMATKIEAAHQMMVRAARTKDKGERNDLEAGMAKYLASEYCSQVVEDSFRIHGGYGFSKEYEIERLYREAPMLLIGEGTADIQRMIIGRRLLEDYRLR